MKVTILTLSILLAATLNLFAADPLFFKQFDQDYQGLHVELLNNPGEKAEISSFVYHKDVATFTFESGTMHLQRFVQNRPTTAVFVGKGHVTIEIPVHAERQSLLAVTKDSTVNQTFESMIIRFSDDFDLALREKFSFSPFTFDWRALAKSAQGETFFKPIIYHNYDNYFRLTMSLYERSADGFFWCDFNRYTFTFDPNWPEEVQIGYEFEGGDLVITTAANFQRKESSVYDDTALSAIVYPLTAVGTKAELSLSGTDGRRIDQAKAAIDLAVNVDSLRYSWLYLKYNLDLDSIFSGSEKIDFIRRNTFDYTGIILPDYVHKGDTLHLTLYYHGKDFDHFLPYVSDPAPSMVEVTFNYPKGYNYYVPGMGEISDLGGGRQSFTSQFSAPLSTFYFHCFPSGVSDTLEVISDIGLTLNYVVADRNTRNLECFIPHDAYRASITQAFNFISSRLGQPPQTFSEYIIPEGFLSMPGVIKVPQVACITDDAWQVVGGFDIPAGDGVARQWFGPQMRLRSEREEWLNSALPVYMGLQHIEAKHSTNKYYSNIDARRDSLYLRLKVGQDVPLAAGYRVNGFREENSTLDLYRTILTNKGVWLLHMLRILMFDYNAGSDAAFNKFLRELCLIVNNRTFSNTDFIRLAEKHYGQPLDWFFRQWLYGAGLPEFKVVWGSTQREGNWYVSVKVDVANVGPEYQMPVMMRVTNADGGYSFSRQLVSMPSTTFELGPFPAQPKGFEFNEFWSVLGRQSVTKK